MMTGTMGMFTFATASTIHAGSGAAAQIGEEAAKRGSRALVVTGSNQRRVESVVGTLPVPSEWFSVSGEPDVESVQQGAQLAVKRGCDVVIAVGGGSAIDAGKAIAALMTNSESIMTYLEVIGEGKPIAHQPAPFIAVPTTAGTGAEVTRNAVLYSKEHGIKVSMRSEKMLPDVAIVDPQLTVTMPPQVTASTGLDALTQLIEPFVSHRSNPLTDALCEAGLVRAARSLRRAFDSSADIAAREDMSIASLFGGLALANAGLGAVHGFAGPMGGMFPIPHGVVCGRLLPFVFKANIAALGDAPDKLARFRKVSQLLTQDANASVQQGTDWLNNLCTHLGVDGLSKFGVEPVHFNDIVEASKRASSMKGNPVVLSDEALRKILAQAL